MLLSTSFSCRYPALVSAASAVSTIVQQPFNEAAANAAQSPFFEVVERLAVLPFYPKFDSRPYSTFSGA